MPLRNRNVIRAIATIAFVALLCSCSTVHRSEAKVYDKCVGRDVDEIIAQAGIISVRDYSQYGLDNSLALQCPLFVHTVLIAGWLDAEEKMRAFVEVPNWPEKRRFAYFNALSAIVVSDGNGGCVKGAQIQKEIAEGVILSVGPCAPERRKKEWMRIQDEISRTGEVGPNQRGNE